MELTASGPKPFFARLAAVCSGLLIFRTASLRAGHPHVKVSLDTIQFVECSERGRIWAIESFGINIRR